MNVINVIVKEFSQPVTMTITQPFYTRCSHTFGIALHIFVMFLSVKPSYFVIRTTMKLTMACCKPLQPPTLLGSHKEMKKLDLAGSCSTSQAQRGQSYTISRHFFVFFRLTQYSGPYVALTFCFL